MPAAQYRRSRPRGAPIAYPTSTSFARCQAAVGLDTESARAISAAVQQGCHARYSNTRLRFSFMNALLAAACDSDSYASDTTALSAAPSFRSSLKAVLLEDQGEDLERLHVRSERALGGRMRFRLVRLRYDRLERRAELSIIAQGRTPRGSGRGSRAPPRPI